MERRLPFLLLKTMETLLSVCGYKSLHACVLAFLYTCGQSILVCKLVCVPCYSYLFQYDKIALLCFQQSRPEDVFILTLKGGSLKFQVWIPPEGRSKLFSAKLGSRGPISVLWGERGRSHGQALINTPCINWKVSNCCQLPQLAMKNVIGLFYMW